jgi:flavin-dependent dehydrogenase
MSSQYDLVVVGARVAGASTALLAARAGYRVLIVDRVYPGDTLSTAAVFRTGVLQLTRWGLLPRLEEAGVPPVRSLVLGFGGNLIHTRLRPEHGVDALYVPRRQTLDPLLLEAAIEAGAEFRPHTHFEEVIRDHRGRVVGVRLEGEGRGTVSTRMLVGADGARSQVALEVGAATYASHPPMAGLAYSYFSGVGSDAIEIQFTPNLGGGFFPTEDDQTLVWLWYPAERGAEIRRGRDEGFLSVLRELSPSMAQRVSPAGRSERFRMSPAFAGHVRQAAGPGWVLVGDSGYAKDPISAHGISAALRDAELAARAIDRALSNPEEEAAAMDGYQQTRDRLSASVFASTAALVDFQWDADEASQLMRGISAGVAEECRLLADLPAWRGVPGLVAA